MCIITAVMMRWLQNTFIEIRENNWLVDECNYTFEGFGNILLKKKKQTNKQLFRIVLQYNFKEFYCDRLDYILSIFLKTFFIAFQLGLHCHIWVEGNTMCTFIINTNIITYICINIML